MKAMASNLVRMNGNGRMSFCFGPGDFLNVSKLCRTLYQDVNKVSREPPEELHNIRDNIGALFDTINRLNDDMNNPQSILKRSA
ncbi:Leucine carboxyl methyltransferase [Macrophomina phaseolina MS6]|uniref:Leucine carboxyl methyltransferase n=1 Tax=Macrophomina phaseolina (strain MS6) TaxID=1126212 RepID=K2RFI4_MACPH|nr:Leucine carboxyl methyltransferase [Macrophomina phaseolina MS6]